MATEETKPNPYTRPAFLIAAAVVLALVVAAVALSVSALGRGNDSNTAPANETPSPAATSAAASSSAGTDPNASVCGLQAVKEQGSLSKPPASKWEFAGSTAVPVSEKHGPAKTDPAGYSYCYSHTPEGAVIATANALAPPTDAASLRNWADYFTSEGPHRASILDGLNEASEAANTRMTIKGFRLLSYTGDTASVDVVATGSSTSGTVTGSFIYDLVWEDGDWKLNATEPEPFNYAPVPDATGYIPWSS